MLATIAVQTKGVRNQQLLIEGLIILLEAKGFEVQRADDKLHISGDGAELVPVNLNMAMATEPAKPQSILQVAHSIVHGDREQTYGDAGKNFRTIAAYWNTHILAAKSIEARLTEADVCGMMILLKQARLANNPNHTDSMVDIAGYTELNSLIQQQKQTS